MAKLKTYRDLEVWQCAVELAVAVYRLSDLLPTRERFAMVDQFRRAVVSVPSNIAEGYARRYRKEYLYHLSIAAGSLAEMETQLFVAGKLGWITREQAAPVWELAQRTGMMLHRLRRQLAR